MTKFLVNFFGILILLNGNLPAQTSGATRIYTVPDGILYRVDGVLYRAASAQSWLAGTQHVLDTDPEQFVNNLKTRYTFRGWQSTGGTNVATRTLVVTADPTLSEHYAAFGVEHALSLNFSNCYETIPCTPPGTVYVNGAPYSADADIFFAAGTTVNLSAVAAPGYVFTGWESGSNQVITGVLNSVTLRAPIIVRPTFQSARRVQIVTVPAEFDVFADRARVATPSNQYWAYGSTHTVGVPTPQTSTTGALWVFSGWSDGGAETHAFTVGPDAPQILTATFVPGTGTDLRTSPPGLSLTVDGRGDWLKYIFVWGAGEIHRLEAPAQQTDDQGRLWQFSSWSNGGPRAQEYTVADSATTVRLTATYVPVGHLTVTSDVAGLVVKVDGADCATPCDVRKPAGTAVRVSAPASLPRGENSRADFDGWPGSGSASADWTVTLGADPVTPNLTYHAMNRLVAAADPPDGVSWRMQPGSPDGFYDAQATVTVSVTPQPGFRFRFWTGDASGSAPAASVSMNAPRQVAAMLERIPYIAPAGVANAAGSTPESGVAAGSVVSIFGASLSPDTIVAPEGALVQVLGCVTVRLGDRLLPLFFVSPSQINLQLPDDTPAGDRHLTVSCQGLPDVQADFQVVRNAPGLFQDANSLAVALHEDGSAVSVDAPARRGELLTLYGTGFGPAQLTRPFGFAMPAASPLTDAVTVQAGDIPTPTATAFAAPARIGVDAVQFRLVDAVPAGNLAIRVTINAKDSNTVLLPVQ